jgi:predicted chitinase
MRASEFITEQKKRKRKSRGAAYGPGPYGGYGYYAGYSGDSGSEGGDGGGGGESIEQEGWKDWVAGAAIGAASLGAAGDADASVKKDLNKPAIQQVVKKKEIKPVAPPKATEKELSKSVTGNSHEVYLRKAAEKAGIRGQELVAFLSQCAHETLDFKHMKEIGGSLDFKKYDPRHAPRKAKILGNKHAGDGAKYKGRGYIQLTGRDNYKKAGQALGLPLEQKPELVEKPEIAAKVAVWYWKTRVANNVDSFKDTQDVTKNINPGLKHLDQRKEKQQAFQIAMR